MRADLGTPPEPHHARMPPVRLVLSAGRSRRRRRAHRLALPTALVTAAGAAVLVMAGPATADTAQAWTTAGTYTVTVPVGAQSVTFDGLGGAGFAGDDAADGVS